MVDPPRTDAFRPGPSGPIEPPEDPPAPESPARRPARDALGEALKQTLATTPLDKVTVAGLSRSAGITRQAFYYHFLDVSDLAVWVFTNEVASHIMKYRSRAEWADGFLKLLLYMQEHREQSYSVIRALSSVSLEQFFFRHLRKMMTAIVHEVEQTLPFHAGQPLARRDRDFVIDHYTLRVVGHLLHWLATDMQQPPGELVRNLRDILDGSVRASLERFGHHDADGPTTGDPDRCVEGTVGPRAG